MNKVLENYTEKRYNRWLDYAMYHCSMAGIPDEASDVLNEVLLSLFQKDENQLMKLLNAKKNQYTELDFYILRMIKFNATSDTAPYRSKYKTLPTDRETDLSRIDIIDEENNTEDKAGEILSKMDIIRQIIDELYLDEKAYAVFEYKFFQDGDFKEWQGTETLKELYDIYSHVRGQIKKKLNGEILF